MEEGNNMKSIYGALMILALTAMPAFSQVSPSSNEIIGKMKAQLDLQYDQVTNITPIIEKYSIAYQDLQKSIDDGTINPSAIDSQRQAIEAQETQEISAYLKPNQLSEWRDMQAQMDRPKDKENSNDDPNADAEADRYTNLPGN